MSVQQKERGYQMINQRSEDILKSIEDFIMRCDELAEEIIENIESTKNEIEEREMKRKRRHSNE